MGRGDADTAKKNVLKTTMHSKVGPQKQKEKNR